MPVTAKDNQKVNLLNKHVKNIVVMLKTIYAQRNKVVASGKVTFVVEKR